MAMRISENMKSYNLLNDMNRSLGRMLKIQQDLATSRRIHKPSDDPAGTTRLMRLKSGLLRTQRYEKNVEDANQFLVSTENTVNQIMGIAQTADSVLLQAASDTLGAEERSILAGQVKEIWDQVVQLGNQEMAGNYLFGGTNTSTPPYTKTNVISDEAFTAVHDSPVLLDNIGISAGSVTVTDGSVTYTEGTAAAGGDYSIDYDTGEITVHSTGTMADAAGFSLSYETEDALTAVLNPAGVDGKINRLIDEGVSMSVNTAADDLLGDENGLLSDLKNAYIALTRNDRDSLSGLRDRLSAGVDRITGVLGEIGTKISRLDTQKEKLATDQVNFEKLISAIEDTDVASAIIELEKEQLVYQSALRTNAGLIKSTLMDYL